MAKPKNKTTTDDKSKLRPPEPLIRPLEEMDISFYQYEVDQFITDWNKGRSLYNLAKEYGRAPEELAVLTMHLSLKGKIKQRRYGALGGSLLEG